MLPDWVSPWWQAVCLPKRWDVCGVSVPSLSVWHTFMLEQVGNGYLCGTGCTLDDAASLLMVAGRDKAGGLCLMHIDLYRQRNQRRIARKLRRLDPEELHAACLEYVTTCTRSPRRWSKEGAKANAAAVPYQLHLVRALCRDYGYTIDNAWNETYGYARTLFDASAEARGDDTIVKPEYEALGDENIANGIDVNARN